MHFRKRFKHLVAAAALAVGGAHTALAAPYAVTYTGTISASSFPEINAGEPFTVTLVVDNGGSSAAGQSWRVTDVACVQYVMNTAQNALFVQNVAGMKWAIAGDGTMNTDGVGVLTSMYSYLFSPNGPMVYSVTGLVPSPTYGWSLAGSNDVFGREGAGMSDASGGVQMSIASWTNPVPFTGTCPSPPSLTEAQETCISTYNKGLAKITGVSLKEFNSCVKKFAKDSSAIPDLDVCTGAWSTPNEKIQAATDKATAAAAAACVGDGSPTVGPINAGGSSPRLWAGLYPPQSLGYELIAGNVINSGDLAARVVECSDEPAGAGCKCQNTVLGQAGKLLATYVKSFNACTKRQFKADAITTNVELAACLLDPALLDPKGKIPGTLSKLSGAIEKNCAAPVTDPLPNGLCAGMTGTALGDCAARRARCNACLTIYYGNELGMNFHRECDLFDDGASNSSCVYAVVGS